MKHGEKIDRILRAMDQEDEEEREDRLLNPHRANWPAMPPSHPRGQEEGP